MKVFPKTKSWGGVSSLGVDVFVTVSFETSKPGSWEAGVAEALKLRCHSRVDAIVFGGRTRGIASLENALRQVNC